MNTLHELLAERADAVADTAHHERVPAVRRRIAVARNRRRATAAGIAAAIIAVAGVALTLPHSHRVQPADAPSRMVGHDVPASVLTTLNATYDYHAGYVGHDGRVKVTLPARDTGYLLWMASRTDTGRLLLVEGGDAVWQASPGAFTDGAYYWVAPGQTVHLKVVQVATNDPGDVALAVYTFARPGTDWFVDDGVMFPGGVNGGELAGAAVGDPGQRSVTVHAAKGARSVEFYLYCAGIPRGAQLAVSTDGERHSVSRGGCEGSATGATIAAPDNSSTGVHMPAGAFTATVEVQDAEGDPLDMPENARIGLGIYRGHDLNAELPGTVDRGGHTWALDRSTVTTGRPGQRRLSTKIGAEAPLLVAYGSHGGARGTVRTWLDGQEQARNQGGGTGWTVLVDGTDETAVRQQLIGNAPRARLFVAVYRMVG